MLNTKKKPLYREKGIPLSGSEKFLSGFAYAAMALLSLIAILPCLHVISKAVSNGPDVTAGNVYFWPVGFQLETVKYVLTQTSFFTALKKPIPFPSPASRGAGSFHCCMSSAWCFSAV